MASFRTKTSSLLRWLGAVFSPMPCPRTSRRLAEKCVVQLCCSNNGRESVAPSFLATVLLLQTYDRVSDEEAKARADFDLRWKVALGIALEDRPFAKSTLQVFRAQLILHEKVLA